MANIEALRPFQADDVPYFLAHLKSLILYEPRLGKTVVTCNVLAKDPLTKDILIACSKNALSVWLDHIDAWFNYLMPGVLLDIRVVRGKNSGAKAVRHELWARPRKPGYITVYLTTFNGLLNDFEYLQTNKLDRFDTIIADEVHTKLRSRKTKTAAMFKLLVKKCRRFHALSGTLTGKWGPADFFGLLNIINPYEFSSYWAFVYAFCVVVENHWGKEIIGVKNMDAFHLILSRFARIRDRKTYGPQMPTVRRDLKHVEMSKEQAVLYEAVGETSMAVTENGTIVLARNSLEKVTRKRQILVCPKIVDPKLGLGEAFEDILDILAEAKENEDAAGQHIVIFTAVRKSLQFFQAALLDAGYRNVFTLAGGTEPEDLVRITNDFRRTKGIMLCTTQFAQAFSLDSAQECYHIGWDYDPNNNKQAEDRLVGQSGTHQINSWYYSYKQTDDEILAINITQKNRIIRVTNKDPHNRLGAPDFVDEVFLPDD